MMLYAPPRPAAHRWRKPLLAAAAFGVVACALTLHWGGTTSIRPAASAGTAPRAEGWQVKLNAEGAGLYSRSGGPGVLLAPAGVLFLPVQAEFSVCPQPETAAGVFVQASGACGSDWEHSGGALDCGSCPPPGHLETRPQNCRAPAKAELYRLNWRAAADAAGSDLWLNVLVLSKAEARTQGKSTVLKVNGKTLGTYFAPVDAPVRRVRQYARAYQPPVWFATLNATTVELPIGEDLSLGQLVAFKDYRGADGKKVYTTDRHTDVLPLRPELIDKLVRLRQQLRQSGVKLTRFWITSGFRTPDYNRAIGGAAYSRHCYGDAVDLVIDEDGDKHMDDLNGDGRVDRHDGILIAEACRQLELDGAVVPGGIGVYEWDGEDSVRSHVHIDCRGYVSRWGQDGSGKHKRSFIWWPKAEFQEEDSGE